MISESATSSARLRFARLRLRSVPFVLLILLVSTSSRGEMGVAAKGEKVFHSDCAKCHALRSDVTGMRGPHLEGLFERRYGAVEGFPYRMVWIDASPRWTAEQLDKYLAIHGRADAEGRAALIEYLARATRR